MLVNLVVVNIFVILFVFLFCVKGVLECVNKLMFLLVVDVISKYLLRFGGKFFSLRIVWCGVLLVIKGFIGLVIF